MATGMIIDPALDQTPVTAGQLHVELETIRQHAQVLVDGLRSAFTQTTERINQHEQVLQGHIDTFQKIMAWHPAAEREIADFKQWSGKCQSEIVGMSNFKDKATAELMALKKAMTDLSTKAGSGGSATGGSHKSIPLVTLKETTVDKLPESVSKTDFDNWVDEFYVHIDRVEGWTGMSCLLKEIRLCKQDLNEELLGQIADKVDSADNDFNMLSMDLKTKDRDLYAYLLKKLNKKLKSLVASTRSGFEVFRRIMREEDPVTESTEYSLRFAFQQMVFQKSSNMEETRKLITVLEKKIVEYREKTGKELDAVLKTIVLHGAVDAEAAPGNQEKQD